MALHEARYDELCRLCASYDATRINLFGQEGRNRQLVLKIQTCLPFEVVEEDPLPKAVCFRCLYNLENFYDFRTICINALSMLQRCLPPEFENKNGAERNRGTHYSLQTEYLKEKENMPILIPEAPIVNPNAALGTPPRLNSDGEAEHDIEEVNHSETEEGCDDVDDHKSEDYEMDMETNPSDFLELTSSVPEDADDVAKQEAVAVLQNRNEQQHEVYVCSLCNKAFSSKGHLSLHARIHVGAGDVIGEKVITNDHTSYKRPYQCDLCNKAYSTAKHRWGHVSTTHRGHPAVTCAHCGRIYSTKLNLEEHVRSRHDGMHQPEEPTYVQVENKFQCKICPKMFNNVTDLNRHSRTCQNERRKEQPIASQKKDNRALMDDSGSECAETEDESKSAEAKLAKNPQLTILKQALTKGSESLKRDLEMRNKAASKINRKTDKEMEGQKRWLCEMCPQGFTSIESLKEHEATHEASKPFVCVLCDKCFALKSSLSRHIQTSHATDPTPYINHESCYRPVTATYDKPTEVQLDSIKQEDLHESVDLVEHEMMSETMNNSASSNVNGNGNRAQYHLFFVCEICGSSHPSKWDRWLHVSTEHADEPSNRCDREGCGKIFATKSLRAEHTQHHMIQGSSPNTCEICGKLWGSRVDYWKHVMGVHTETVPRICGVCLKVFQTVAQLSAHVREKHWPLTNGDYSCDICGRPYSNKSKMTRHRKIHGVDEPPSPIAPAIEFVEESTPQFDLTSQLLSHNSLLEKAASMHPENEHFCESCEDLSFPTAEALMSHRKKSHSIYPCDLCDKRYGRTSHLWKHVSRMHKGHYDVTCRYCSKISANKDHLITHIEKSHRLEPDAKEEIEKMRPKKEAKEEKEECFNCPKCQKLFHKRYLLRRHMKGCQIYRKDPGALLTRCRACERIFKDRASLQKHIENHHTTYTCHLCNETITSKLGIMTHNRVLHMLHPDLTCEFANCRKLFRTKEDLQSHRNEHKNHAVINVCDYCGDTVENKLKLKMHVLSLHRNEIGVSCGVCLIPMNDPKELKQHVENTHIDILMKPNTCQVCGKQYASKWKAFDHTKKCHGKVFKTCKQCLAVFTTDDDLKYHYQHIHRVSKEQLALFESQFDSRKPDPMDSCVVNVDPNVKQEPIDDEDMYDDIYADQLQSSKSVKRKKSSDTYDCEICPEMFLNYETLSDHYRNVHNIEPTQFKKLKGSSAKRIRRGNFECKSCKKQYTTKAHLWNHMNVCSKSLNQSAGESTSSELHASILEAHLKNNNQIIKRDEPPPESSSNLNIPDFNLFEDINMQLSGQKPMPNLMPLAASAAAKKRAHSSSLNLSSSSNSKYSRKDSRKVYDESTNTECTCEVCGKPWPAKKHLWQHLIRFHRAEAAVTCGVCLKLCSSYDDLAEHLKMAHQTLLSCEGNNFTCKICGRYHNARSKLSLHMSIHINYNGVVWCKRCQMNFANVDALKEHMATCTIKQTETDAEVDEESSKRAPDEPQVKSEHEQADNDNDEDEDEDDEDEDEDDDNENEDEDEEEEDEDGEGEEGLHEQDEDEEETGEVAGEETAEFESEVDAEASDNESNSNSDDSDSGSNSSSSGDEEEDDEEEEEGENEREMREGSSASNSRSIDSDYDKSQIEVYEQSGYEENQQMPQMDESIKQEQKHRYAGQNGIDYSDDDGPPVLSPMMPIMNMQDDDLQHSDQVRHKLSPMVSIRPKSESTNSLGTNENDLESSVKVEEQEAMKMDDRGDEDYDEMQRQSFRQVEEYEEEVINEENEEFDMSTYDKEQTEQVVVYEEEQQSEGENLMQVEVSNDNGDVQIHNLNGTVLMIQNDSDGNPIFIQQNDDDSNDYVYQDSQEYELDEEYADYAKDHDEDDNPSAKG